MKVTIAHLYFDLLNLYGESGNIKVLKQTLEEQDISVNIKFLTIDDNLDFSKYDLVYMGMGTEENQKLVLRHLMKYKDDINKYYQNNKFFLITGNSIDLFGKYLIDKKKKYKCLNLFNYNSKIETFRMADEVLFKSKLTNEYILGFQNQNSIIKGNDKPLFEVVKGIGSFPLSTNEGIHENNFYGTYIIGPLLARNPMFLKMFVTNFITSLNPDFKFKPFNLNSNIEAYDHFMKNYYKDYINKKTSY